MAARWLHVPFLAALLLLRTPGDAWFREDFGPGWEGRWKSRSFRGELQRAGIENEGDNPVLRLDSSRSAGGYFAPVTGDAREVGWRWKVAFPLTGAAPERSKAGDDYAARVFVLFDPLPLGRRTRAICYVWARAEPRESLFPSPYLDRVATIVLESGGDRTGDWVSERRVLGDDFRRSFGSPPPPVKGVAIMVDTDDTRARATAWFDDVVLR
jgi:hypothetical protein